MPSSDRNTRRVRRKDRRKKDGSKRRSTYVPTSRDAFGHLDNYVECESAEAASHWDARRWNPAGRHE